MVDIHDFGKRLERAERVIQSKDVIDKNDVRKFVKFLEAEGVSSGRIAKYLYSLKTLQKLLGKSFRKAKRSDIEELVRRVDKYTYRDKEISEASKRDFRICLKKYFKWLKGRETYPKEVSWIKTTEKNNNHKLPSEILNEAEIKKLSETAYTTRDKAFVLSLYESGCRIGEFLPLKMKDLEFDKYGCVIRVTGKTGDRRVRLVASNLALTKWLEEHPNKNNPDCFLWCKIASIYNPKVVNDHLSYGFCVRLLKELAEKSGIKKNVNPHSFRHSRATFLADKLTEAQMKEVFGWSKSSKMVGTYVHLSGRNIDNSILKINGIVPPEKAKLTLYNIECSKCQTKNHPASTFCSSCGYKLCEDEEKVEETLIEFIKVIGEVVPEARTRFKEIAKRHDIEHIFR